MTTLSPFTQPVKAGLSLEGPKMSLEKIVKKQKQLRLKKSELAESVENIKLQLEIAKLKEERCNEELDVGWYISAKAALRHIRKEVREIDMELALLNDSKREAFDCSFTELARTLLEKGTFEMIKEAVQKRLSGEEDGPEAVHSYSDLSA